MKILQHKFVEFIPEQLEEGILYVSIGYKTAAHKCMCGCGNKVITPISPVDWQMSFNGKTVSLRPSIGSWNLDCKSHYFITNNEVKWVRSWPRNETKNKERDKVSKKESEDNKTKGEKKNILQRAMKKLNKRDG